MLAGTDYFKKGAAAAQMESRKAGEYVIMVLRYGELRPRIQHGAIVHEVSGGLSMKASHQLSEVLDIAKELKVGINYQEEGAEHTWMVNDFAMKWVQGDVVHNCKILCNDCAGRSSKGSDGYGLVPQDLAIVKAGRSSQTVSLRAFGSV